jgi:hypothetical protein
LILITCVHGLHYVGDRLSLLQRASPWLSADGLLVGNLDLANLRIEERTGRRRASAKYLRSLGVEYDSRRQLIKVEGRRNPQESWTYRGAEKAGPNYTGQPALNSYYFADVRP